MFTGLVEGLGAVVQVVEERAGRRLTIRPAEALQDGTIRIGDSVALNGCCLTVVRIDETLNPGESGAVWEFQAGPETLAKTNLGEFTPGTRVNMERALKADARLGGHFVQGHVDGIGRVLSIEPDGEWVTIWFQVPVELTRAMVPKGSIAVDGISLTLVEVHPDRFSVALIPHTLAVTNLGFRQVGQTVNIETDILGKYVCKLIGNNT